MQSTDCTGLPLPPHYVPGDKKKKKKRDKEKAEEEERLRKEKEEKEREEREAAERAAARPAITLEINLWRADLITGVLELDSSGKVVNTSEHQLNPPGLVFGTSNEQLMRKHISKLLPLGNRPVADLFEVGMGANKSGKKSLLKNHKKRESWQGVLRMS